MFASLGLEGRGTHRFGKSHGWSGQEVFREEQLVNGLEKFCHALAIFGVFAKPGEGMAEKLGEQHMADDGTDEIGCRNRAQEEFDTA